MASYVKGQMVRVLSKKGTKTILIAPIEEIDVERYEVAVKDFLGNTKRYPFTQIEALS